MHRVDMFTKIVSKWIDTKTMFLTAEHCEWNKTRVFSYLFNDLTATKTKGEYNVLVIMRTIYLKYYYYCYGDRPYCHMPNNNNIGCARGNRRPSTHVRYTSDIRLQQL